VEVNSIRLQSKTALKLWRRYITLGIYVVFGKYYRVSKVNQSHYRPKVPRGFQEVKVPRLRDSGPEWW